MDHATLMKPAEKFEFQPQSLPREKKSFSFRDGGNMDAVTLQPRYLKLTKMYSKAVGIWPGQKKCGHYILRTVVYVIMITCILAQVAHLVYFFDMETLTNQIFVIGTCTIALAKHGVCAAKGSKVIKYIHYAADKLSGEEFKVLLDGMVKDLETYKTKEELAILHPYMNKAIVISTLYSYGTMTAAVLFIQLPLVPLVADIVVPLNTSRPRIDTMQLYYYFVDVNDCYYWSVLHADIAILITASSSVACDTSYVHAVQHACGLFDVVGYRFKCAIRDIPDVQKVADMSNKTYRKVCQSIMAHDHATRYVRNINDFYGGTLFISVGLTVVGFSCSLFCLSKLKPSEEFYIHLTSLLTELWHIMFLTLLAQLIINRTDNVYKEIYEGLWYNSMPKTQALFTLALRAAMKPPQITAGGLIPMNLQTFAEIVKLSFSYFTVLQSV